MYHYSISISRHYNQREGTGRHLLRLLFIHHSISMCSMSQLKNPTLEWLSAAVSVTEEDVWCNIFTSRKQQISIPLPAPDRVSHLISAAGVSAGPGVPGVPISTLSPPSHMSTLYSLCVSQLSLIMYLVAVCRYPYKAQHISLLSVYFIYLMRYPYLLALV